MPVRKYERKKGGRKKEERKKKGRKEQEAEEHIYHQSDKLGPSHVILGSGYFTLNSSFLNFVFFFVFFFFVLSLRPRTVGFVMAGLVQRRLENQPLLHTPLLGQDAAVQAINACGKPITLALPEAGYSATLDAHTSSQTYVTVANPANITVFSPKK